MTHRPDMPCAGGCGRLMWRSHTSLPEGDAMCRLCRRDPDGGYRHGTQRRYAAGCRCEVCRAEKSRSQRERVRRLRAEGIDLTEAYRNPAMKRWFISRKKRREVYERDNWVCQLCATPVDRALPPNDRMAASLDHIEPQSAALLPDHSLKNLRLVHRSCNSQRGARAVLVEARRG